MLFALSVTLATPLVPRSTSPGPGPAIDIASFSRDMTIFDSDAANGNNAADIPLSGTTDAPDGAIVESRIVRADTGAEVAPWAVVAQAGGGAWSGTYAGVPRSAHWLRPEARVQGSTATATTTNRFGVGLVILIEEQSNLERGLDIGLDGLAPASVTIGNAEGDFQAVITQPSGGGTKTGIRGPFPVHDGNARTTSLAMMARVAADAAPGLKVMVGFLSRSGSPVTDWLRDAETDAPWSVAQELFAALRADGSEIGLFAFNHGSNLAASPGSWAAVLWGTDIHGNLLPGLNADRTIANPPATIPALSGTAIDHMLAEPGALPGLLTGRTRWLYHNMGGQKPNAYPGGIADRRVTEWRVDTPYGRARSLPQAPRYFGGYQASNDHLHWTGNDFRGMPYRYSVIMHQVMRGVGMITPPVPRFDRVAWEPNGAWIEVWIDGRDVTTSERIRNGGAATNYQYVPDSEVLGFVMPDGSGGWLNAWTEIVDADGNPATAGRVRIYPPGGPSGGNAFDGTSLVYYHAAADDGSIDGDNGGLYRPADHPATLTQWTEAMPAEHFPLIVDSTWLSSVYGGRFVAPAAPGFINGANDIATQGFAVVGGSVGYTATQNTQEAWFSAALTGRFDMSLDNVAAGNVILAKHAQNGIVWLVLTDGSVQVASKTFNANSVVDRRTTAPGVITNGARHVIHIAQNGVTDTVRVWVDGVERALMIGPEGPGDFSFNTSQSYSVLGDPDQTGVVYGAHVWEGEFTPAERAPGNTGNLWISIVGDGVGNPVLMENPAP